VATGFEWIVSTALLVLAGMMDAHVDVQLEGRRALHDGDCRRNGRGTL
jgi:hypothetical protein